METTVLKNQHQNNKKKKIKMLKITKIIMWLIIIFFSVWILKKFIWLLLIVVPMWALIRCFKRSSIEK